VQHEGDVCFTTKGDDVYAIFLKWPGDEFKVKSLRPADGSKITMLGVPGDLPWTWDEANGLTITYPSHKSRPTSCAYAWAFKIKQRKR
jgi:alpha-L-fucosidase